MDPRRVNGAVFLGLEGVVIKSHGGADAFGFARAVQVGCEMVEQDLLARIRQAATLVEGKGAEAAQPQEAGEVTIKDGFPLCRARRRQRPA